VTSAIVTIFADGYWMLYWGTFILALGNGTVEAVINPVTATIFPKEKTKWLNILHAGWPAGLVLGGILAILMGPEVNWKWKVALVLLPTVVYGAMLLGRKFPVQERVKAGVTFKDMLSEAGAIGFLIIFHIILMEVNRVAELTPLIDGEFLRLPHWSLTALLVVVTLSYYLYTKSLGRPMFILLLLLMFPLATTELGTDSWITELLVPFLGDNAGWVIVYTALIMVVLRFFAGPIVHKLSPLGLLAASSALAIVGLLFLSKATGFAIFIAATIYGVGKTLFWPTMLGVTS
jgi:MFS family permease